MPPRVSTNRGGWQMRPISPIMAVFMALLLALPGTPVTAKVRAGFDDASRLEEIARAVRARLRVRGKWRCTSASG